jgi:membrane-associated protein
MESIAEFFRHLRSLDELIRWGGLLALIIIVFAETGLLVGFFLPGDSLLITAGLFAARGDLPIAWLLLSLSAAAIAGDTVGYWIGNKTGPRLFARPDSRLFKREHLLRTQEFYEKHGGKTIVLARFMPLIRTFAPVVAGVAGMPYARFMQYNVWGGIGWVFSMCLTGYFLAIKFPGLVQHIEKVIVVVVLLSILPMVWHAYKERSRARSAAKLPAEISARREPVEVSASREP